MTTNRRITRFTAKLAAKLPPGDHTDPAAAGLQLRVRLGPSGESRTWFFRYKWRGRQLRILIGHLESMGLADARAAAIDLRRGIDQGIDPRRARSRRRQPKVERTLSASAADTTHTIDNLAHEFLERYVRPSRRKPQYVEAILKRDILPEWSGRDARTIKPREVIELLDKIVGRGSRIMANRAAGILSQMFKFAVHRAIIETTPVQLLMRPGGREKPRERALDDAEIGALLCNLDDVMRSPRMAHAIRLLLATGQRRGELALARWRDIDLTARIWHIPPEHSKTGAPHAVPLSDFAVREFERLKAATPPRCKFVFAADEGDAPIDPKLITRVIARNRKSFEKLKVAPFTAHDLRRTCRTGLAKLKIEPHVAERVLNHKQPGIVGVYDVHTYAPEMREALEKWGTHLSRLLRI